MPSTTYAYVNGKFVPEAEARVSIFDRGFLHGNGCFETMRVYGGRLFRALEHFERLLDGLRALDIPSPFSPEELHAICRSLQRLNQVTEGVARVHRTPDSIVATVQSRRFERRELRAIISSLTVSPFISRHKTANRLAYLLAQREATQEGADEAVLLDPAGALCEFATANLFVVKHGELFTPTATDGALPGITRGVVLDLARELKIPAYEVSLQPAFLDDADEVFATNSLIEIAPVITWSRQQTLTRRLQTAYQEQVALELAAR